MTNVASGSQSSEYRVDLNVFHGPLDLLLHLIRKDEVDIYDVPIARITRQYLKYIEVMQVLNLEVVGEYILMAATLIRIKTKLLLPRDESDADEPDLREELIMALIEYRKFKEAADILREKAVLEERNYIPPLPVGIVDARIDEYTDVSLFDLVSAFKDVLAARRDEVFHEVEAEQISVKDRMEYVAHVLRQRESATFGELFADIPRKMVAVVTLIALLEMTRARRVTMAQSVSFAELRVYRGERFFSVPAAVDLVDYRQPQEEVVV